MKRIFALVCALALLCAAAYADTMVVHITATNEDLNSVGTKWAATYSMGGYEICDGDVIDLDVAKYEFYAEIGEYDSKPDIGSATNTFNVTASRLQKGFTVYQTVVVTENSGMYKDYWTEWVVRYDFLPVGYATVLQ